MELTRQGLDTRSLEKSGRWVSAIIIEFIVLNDLLVVYRIPTDPHADVGSHGLAGLAAS